MFAQKQGLETAVAVARRRDAQFAVFGQHRLGSDAVTVVARRLRLLRAGRVAKMVRQLGVQRRFDQRLLERDPRRLNRALRHGAGQELGNQLHWDRGLPGYGTVKFVDSAWHNTPSWRWLCPAHRITDRLRLLATRVVQNDRTQPRRAFPTHPNG